MADDLRVSNEPLSERETVLINARLEDLARTLGAPGDYGYGTALGDLTLRFHNLRTEFAIALARAAESEGAS